LGIRRTSDIRIGVKLHNVLMSEFVPLTIASSTAILHMQIKRLISISLIKLLILNF
jgi:hypothetical protein